MTESGFRSVRWLVLLAVLTAAPAQAEGPSEALQEFAAAHEATAVAGIFGRPGATGRPYSIEVEERLTSGPVALQVAVFDVARRGDELIVVFAEHAGDGIAGFYVFQVDESEVAQLLAEEARGEWLVAARVSAVQRSLPGISAQPEPPYVARGDLLAVTPAP
jgi:hypothetical protein